MAKLTLSETKKCITCKEEKDVDQFYLNRRWNARMSYCKDCNRERVEEWHVKNPEKKNLYNVKRKYGLSSEDFQNLYETQDGKCALCDKEKKLVVDHCHGTGKVRGLLCIRCNTALGCFENGLVDKVVEYLECRS